MANLNTYHEVTAEIDGEKEIMFGSFVRQDCVYEIQAERDSWKEDGYKKIKIERRETTDTPDAEVYKDEIVTKHELFMAQAPSFNFELDEDQLLEKAIERGYVTKIEGMEGKYLVNKDY